jgi:glycosyltransferase involved in cell wall biosynthesis
MTEDSRSETETSPAIQKPRLWVVSEVYYPEETSTGYYLTKIAEGLTAKFNVKVLCGQPNYSARGVLAPKREEHNAVKIFRAAGTTLNRKVLLFRLINMATLGLSILFHGLMRFRRGDSVLVVTTPPSMPFIVAFAALVKGSVYTLLIHDSYPENMVAVGMLKRGSSVFRFIEFMNRWLYKHARKIIVVGRDMRDLVRRKAKGLDLTISVIPNWAETDDVRPQPRSKNELLRSLGIMDKLVFQHAGNIGYPTDVETFIECLKRLSNDESFHFLFIGSGVKQVILENAIKEWDLKNLTLLPPMPRSEQIDFLNACDVGIVSLVEGMWGAAMPSKTYNIMAAGKPILALTDEGSEVEQVINEEEIGWCVRPADPDRLIDALKEIYRKRQHLTALGLRARAAAEAKYCLATALARYENELS